MQYLLNFFNQAWVGSVIGIVGMGLAIVGIFSYKISKSTAKPTFQKSSLRLLGQDKNTLPQEVTVLYKGKEVDRLTKTTLIFWNNGTEMLEGKNIVQADPIRICFDNGDHILSHTITKRTKEVNNFNLVKKNKTPNQLKVTFDYLDPNDGVSIEILHDSKSRYPKIEGTIKGISGGFIDRGKVHSPKPIKLPLPFGSVNLSSNLILYVGVVFGVIMSTLGMLPEELFDSLFKVPDERIPLYEKRWLFVVIGVLYAAIPAIPLWTRRKNFLNS